MFQIVLQILYIITILGTLKFSEHVSVVQSHLKYRRRPDSEIAMAHSSLGSTMGLKKMWGPILCQCQVSVSFHFGNLVFFRILVTFFYILVIFCLFTFFKVHISLGKKGETEINIKKITQPKWQKSIKWSYQNNVLFTLNRTKCSSVLLLCVVRFNGNKTLHIKKNKKS